MRLAATMLEAVGRELRHIGRRGARNVHVDVRHMAPGELVATVESSLGEKIEVRRFVCWERHAKKSPTKREVWSRPETTIVVRVA